MKKSGLTLLTLLWLFSFSTNAQEVEVFQTFGSNSIISMKPNPAGGNNFINLLNTGDFDKSLLRFLWTKNELPPPEGPLEFAWEVGLGANIGIVDPDFFSISKYIFNIDFIVQESAIVIDNITMHTGIGEVAPKARLHVYNEDTFAGSANIPAAVIGRYGQAFAGYGYLTVDQPTNDQMFNIARFRDNGLTQVWINRSASTYQLEVFGDGRVTGLWITSDQKLKKNVKAVSKSLPSLRKLKPASYLFKRDVEENAHLPEELQFGLIAQDVKKIYPNLVRESDRKTEDDSPAEKTLSVNYIGLIPVLIASVQELDATLTAKNSEIGSLKRENKEMQSRIERLETLMEQLLKK